MQLSKMYGSLRIASAAIDFVSMRSKPKEGSSFRIQIDRYCHVLGQCSKLKYVPLCSVAPICTRRVIGLLSQVQITYLFVV